MCVAISIRQKIMISIVYLKAVALAATSNLPFCCMLPWKTSEYACTNLSMHIMKIAVNFSTEYPLAKKPNMQ